MPADLTRFDWNALNFSKSENVQRMTAEEVGAYVLLLNEAWLMAKDASLPDDINFLKRIARVENLSTIVLERFPIVDTPWGARRRNNTLYGEWVTAQDRSENGRKAAISRWDKPSLLTPAYASLVHSHEIRTADACNSQSPSQVNPNQTKPSQVVGFSGSLGQCSFKNISIRYASYMGVSHSHNKKHIEKYQAACAKYGEDRVLEFFDQWVKTAGWLKERRDTNGLNLFWRPLDDLAQGADLARERKTEKEKPVVLDTTDVFARIPDPDELTPEQLAANRDKI